MFPGEYGVPRPWYFPVQKSYWCGFDTSEDDMSGFHDLERSDGDRVRVEEEPKGYPLGVAIEGLSKTYG